ncbi:hypothetical protein BH23CYA1_BH23CYA1_02030 [soil metagenome]
MAVCVTFAYTTQTKLIVRPDALNWELNSQGFMRIFKGLVELRSLLLCALYPEIAIESVSRKSA